MSQRDVLAELRTARISAPPELRERVRLIAVADSTPPRKIVTWRRSVALLVPVAAAIAAAVVLTRPAHHQPRVVHGEASIGAAAPKTFALPTTPKRVQRYSATLSLRVHDQPQLSDAVKQALRMTSSLGGYASSTHVSTGSAQLVLKVPRTKVVLAFARLAKLGTIVGERVDIRDQQATVNANLRTMARLRRELKSATTKRQIAQLTARIEALQRANANTIRADRYATVSLNLATPPQTVAERHGHGPLHWIGVGFKWVGIGLAYFFAFGIPAMAIWLVVRVVRKKRIDALLNS